MMPIRDVSFISSTRLVFSNWAYIVLAIVVIAIFWIIFNYFDQLLFFSPYLAFYYPIPKNLVGDFVLSNVIAPLIGIVVSMNFYYLLSASHMAGVMKNSKSRTSPSVLFSGSSLSLLSSLCTSCYPSVGYIIVALFGSGVGVALSSFLSGYQLPLRFISLAILIWGYYSVSKNLTIHGNRSYCLMKDNNDKVANQ